MSTTPDRPGLPLPYAAGPLTDLLVRRRSGRRFTPRPVTAGQLGGLLWAAQGATGDGHRTCPSAHATYPLTVTAVVGAVDGVPAGIHRYDPAGHALTTVAAGDHREAVAGTSLADAAWLGSAPVLLVVGADLAAADRHFADQPPAGRRGHRYVWLEAGHASQNVYLQATASGLTAVLVGGFDDDAVRALPVPVLVPGDDPLAILAVGHG